MAEINAMLADRVSEELFLDFKKSGDNGGGNVLHASDNKNLSKAIAGFGNSAGGVVVWGVECAARPDGADLAATLHPVHNAQAFRSRLESAISRLTVPPHDGVENIAVTNEGEVGGFVVTLVPQSSRAPLRAEAPGLRNYYLRSGSSFEVIPHDALAGLFGRPPRAKVALQFVSLPARRPQHQQDDRLVLAFSLAIANTGAVLAEKPYMSVWWGDTGEAKVSVHQKREAFPVRMNSFPGAQAVALDGMSLAPDAVDEVLDCLITVSEDPVADLSIRITTGARNAEPEITRILGRSADLRAAVDRSRRQQLETSEVLMRVVDQV
ncbi:MULTISPECIES: AlbA family DNA-binding domain-containing protein [Lysobacteraceae]|uniref:AlbA family DNA-binding domain-containing protein n=1 Tax=Lysobacteraceae TaxID=32033 RepID=UPI001BCFE6D2|nr:MULTISPECIES: ATP-binding protein [Lysobacter]